MYKYRYRLWKREKGDYTHVCTSCRNVDKSLHLHNSKFRYFVILFKVYDVKR